MTRPAGQMWSVSKTLTEQVLSGQEEFETSQVGSGRVPRFPYVTGRVGSGRVGSGRVGSGRVGSGQGVIYIYSSFLVITFTLSDLIDKPWTPVSSLLPTGTYTRSFLSRIDRVRYSRFSAFFARRFSSIFA